MSSRNFPQTFSLDLISRKSFDVQIIWQISKKYRDYLGQNLVNGIEQTSLKSNIFFCVILAECGLALSWRNTLFLLLMSAIRFLARFSFCWELKSVLSVWLGFKNSKWIIPWWSHHIHSITFLLWISTVSLNSAIKTDFFITCNVIVPWKKTCHWRCEIFFILFA